MLFMPDISMVEYENDNEFTHSRFFIERRKIGQQKTVARPT